MFSCSCCGKEFSRNFNRKRHEKQCQSNLSAINEDDHKGHHGNSFDKDEDSNHSLSSTQHENDSNDESDKQSEDSSDSSDNENDEKTPWKHLVSQAFKDNRDEYNRLMEHFQEEGLTEDHAQSEAHNALLKKYRKALRERLVDEVLYFRRLRKTPIYQKIMETKKEFKDLDDFDDEEALRSAVKKREFLLNRLIEPMEVNDSDDSEEEDEGNEEEEEEEEEEEGAEDEDSKE